MTSLSTLWYQKKRDEMIEALGSSCELPEKCKISLSSSELELHFSHIRENHISGRGRGSFLRISDIFRNPDNYLLLTRYCHRIFDSYEQEEKEKIARSILKKRPLTLPKIRSRHANH